MEKENSTVKQRRTLLSIGTIRGIIFDIINLLFIASLWYISRGKVGHVFLTIITLWAILTIFNLCLDIYCVLKK